jgi:hypothetical protein
VVTSLISSAAFSILMLLMSFVLRKVAPVAANPTGRSLEDLRSEYLGWYILASALYLVLWAVATAALAWLPIRLSHWRYSLMPPASFEYTPGAFWIGPALFLGLGAAIFPLVFVLKALLRDRLAEFIHYADRMVRYDQRKASPWAFGLIAIVVFPLVFIGLDTYTRFMSDHVVNNPMSKVSERIYAYDEIERLAHVARFRAPNGNIIDEPYYLIVFGGGDRWSTRNQMSIRSPGFDGQVFEFLSEKTGLPIDQLEFAP